MYNIYRYFRKEGKGRQFIKKVATLELAQLHCNDPKTRKEGVWFDGYQKA
jgi:hypothetical protein